MTNEHTEFSKTLAQLREQNPDLLNLMLEFGRWLEAFPGIYGSPTDIEYIAEKGAAQDYVLAWLDHEAKSKTWKRNQADTQQLSLF